MVLIQFEQNGVKHLTVEVPDKNNDYKIIRYSHAGTWLMETNSKNLNAWKVNIPQRKYIFIGNVSSLTGEQCSLLVDRGMSFGFWDYDSEFVAGLTFYDLAILSLESRIRSLGGSDDANYVILKEVK